ncbi:MAG TPA: aldolase/citrate lyase family protein [Steroidobacteraceae bacterium]
MTPFCRMWLSRPRAEPHWDLNGPVMLGVHLSFLSPELVKYWGTRGFRWLFLDAQTTPLTPTLARELVCVADQAGMLCLVRVRCIDIARIDGFLNAGVAGIIAPNIRDATDAQALVAAVKFRRHSTHEGSPQSGAANDGLPTGDAEVKCAAGAVALIESSQGIQHLEDILAVPGLDYVAFGPGDLAASLGAAGRDDARVQELLTAARAKLKAAGKPGIDVVSSAAQGQAAVANGAALIAMPDKSLLLIRSTADQLLEGMRPLSMG